MTETVIVGSEDGARSESCYRVGKVGLLDTFGGPQEQALPGDGKDCLERTK